MQIMMLLFCLVMPLLGLLLGFALRHAGDEPNPGFGYRTRRAMAGREQWQFANDHAGRLWMRFALPTLVLTVVACVVGWGRLEWWCLWMTPVQLFAIVILPLILTERELKKRFGK